MGGLFGKQRGKTNLDPSIRGRFKNDIPEGIDSSRLEKNCEEVRY